MYKTRTIKPILDRVLSKLHYMFGCWEFWGATAKGYGRVGRGRKGSGQAQAHRVVYEELVGPIPEGLTLDHLCRNELCCNPLHLEPVTKKVNTERGTRPLIRKYKVKGHSQ